MKIEFEPIEFISTFAGKVPRHWTVSEAEGALVINEEYAAGLKDVKAVQRIIVFFIIHNFEKTGRHYDER
jgi:tRNA (Thr-GGU) A37 N-methylase